MRAGGVHHRLWGRGNDTVRRTRRLRFSTDPRQEDPHRVGEREAGTRKGVGGLRLQLVADPTCSIEVRDIAHALGIVVLQKRYILRAADHVPAGRPSLRFDVRAGRSARALSAYHRSCALRPSSAEAVAVTASSSDGEVRGARRGHAASWADRLPLRTVSWVLVRYPRGHRVTGVTSRSDVPSAIRDRRGAVPPCEIISVASGAVT